MVAALQAPIIMMSQNRQSAKDRLQASHDYEVNLKAEVQIAALHVKLDELREAKARLDAAGIATHPIDHDVTKSLYFADPDGHLMEVITRPYGSSA